MTEQLKPCPFCGGGTTEITENGRVWTGMKWGEPSSVSVRHWCEEVPGQPSRMLERVGRDHEAAIAAWNRRDQPAQAGAEPVAWMWHKGHPPFPQDQEWFIAETIYGDRVVLRSLDEGREHKGNYAFTTADSTYMKAEIIRRWMQFPDCQYIPPARAPLTDEEIDAVIEAAHHSLRQYKYAVRGQQITQFDGIEAHVIRETERAHDIKE